MRIAIIGSHGTGKTTIVNQLKKEFKNFYFYEDIFRELSYRLKYSSPREIIEKSGSLALIAAALNSYFQLGEKTDVILDQAPVSILAYYLAHLEQDKTVNTLVWDLTKYYSKMIDMYIFVPANKIPLVADDMRPTNRLWQLKISNLIEHAANQIGIDEDKIYHLKSTDLNKRYIEVSKVIHSKSYSRAWRMGSSESIM